MKKRVARPLPVFLVVLLFGVPALGTWSIVVIKKSTGEVCIGAATCLPSTPIRRIIAVMVVGKGAGCAQANGESGVVNRGMMFDGLMAGESPERIMNGLLTMGDNPQTRQFGIAAFSGFPASFSGSNTSEANPALVGDDGDIAYAIQGNILTGDIVALAAEQALLTAPGDLSQKVMAAMEAARSFGGDGRCSCTETAPMSCGAPPPSFTHSAYTSFILMARHGDTDGDCNPTQGCANGTYYLWKKAVGDSQDDDAVIRLQRVYDDWRLSMAGVTDHVLTRVVTGAQRLVADGVTATDVTVYLKDLDGARILQGGQQLSVTAVEGGSSVAIGPVSDLGDGRHRFTVTSTSTPGDTLLRLVVQDGAHSVQLYPDLELAVDPLAELHVGWSEVEVTSQARVPFVLNRTAADAGRPYQVLGSASGTSPGTPWADGLTLPLNADRFLNFTMISPGPPLFPGSAGQLDAAGRAGASLIMRPGLYGPFVGGRLDFAAVLAGSPDELTNVVGFDVVP